MTILYADGSCHLADLSGGWAWWVSQEMHDSGFVMPATNNTMELTAVIYGLEALEWDVPPLEVVSDSAYVINGMNQRWYEGWRRRGWRTSQGTPVANVELWVQLIEIQDRWPAPITWTHVRGHGRGDNDPAHHVLGNSIVDRMAGAARKAGIAGVDQDAARQRALAPSPARRRRLTMNTLEGVAFWLDGETYIAASIEDDRTVLLRPREA